MIGLERRYEFVTAQQRYYNEKIIEAFLLFVKLATAIVGGVVWLNIQELPQADQKLYNTSALWLFVAVATATLMMVWVNLDAWWGYREAEIDLSPEAPKLKPFLSCRIEILMSLIIIFAVWAFVKFCGSVPTVIWLSRR